MAFHPYPHLIRGLFKAHRSGPPPGLTLASAWTGIDRPVSGPWPATRTPVSDSLSLRLRQWPRPRRRPMTRWLIMQKARGRGHSRSRRLWTQGFRVCFTPLGGVLFTFPSRYWFAIGLRVVLSLGGWSPLLRTGFHVPRPTRDPAGAFSPSRTGVLPSSPRLPRRFRWTSSCLCGRPTTPPGAPGGLGSSAFARRYSRSLG